MMRTRTYACAPSVNDMNGRFDQSLSTAGSIPSSTPSHVSISGPLYSHVSCLSKSATPRSAAYTAKDDRPRVVEVHDADYGGERRHVYNGLLSYRSNGGERYCESMESDGRIRFDLVDER